MNLFKEVVYLTGNSAKKRRIFNSDNPSLAKAANDEISVVCHIRGSYYYVVGNHPFARFTVLEYMRYQRSLADGQPLSKACAAALLKKFRVSVSLNTRLGKLDVITRRLVVLAAAADDKTSILALNLDGIPFSRKVRSRLHAAVKRLSRDYSVYVSVTDSRFIPKSAYRLHFKSDSFFTKSLPVLRSSLASKAAFDGDYKAATFSAAPPVVEKGKIVKVVVS